ncbi:MAG: flagellar basal body rod protein FlgC [Terracidiphilus sp.]|jgi:flagellar basal-body rod protein FlgC
MGMFNMMQISASALAAERQRAEVTSANLANAETSHTDQGGPYVRKEAVFSAVGGSLFHSTLSTVGGFAQAPAGSVRLTDVVDDPSPPVQRYEPGNPDADATGYVSYPAINPINEMVDLMGCVRSYQLNASAISAEKQMVEQSIGILKPS